MNHSNDALKDIPLGKTVTYPEQYDASLLFALPRAQARMALPLFGQGIFSAEVLPFHGDDVWTAYELSWLNTKGKPQVAIGELRIPCDSTHMIESKSLKLYLNSLNQTAFDDWDAVQNTIMHDISTCLGSHVAFELSPLAGFEQQPISKLHGECMDDLDICMDVAHASAQQPQVEYLRADASQQVEECLVSHLLKSNCRITSQPDWASVQIHYHGAKLCQESLLRYLISFRNVDEFHEPCVERIFHDILQHCQPEKLSVYARYTRRGGLDINPFRSNFEATPKNERLPRQ